MQEENKISRKRIKENWTFLEEMKLEMENFRSEQEMEVFQKNSEFHGRKGKLSTLPTENPQTSKPSFSLPSLSEKQEKVMPYLELYLVRNPLIIFLKFLRRM